MSLTTSAPEPFASEITGLRPYEIHGPGINAPVSAPRFRRSEPSAQAPPPPAESDRLGTRKKDDRRDDRAAPPSDKWRPRFSR
uniref:Eukaryotic translation initiation factor 3 subunit A-like n=1 Tax=Tanacetum cinerariifolium TaxID=118510 RepID=A0A699HLE3_TANCI|nr:eukaryotic translation initiation factor 3 subunit A-like [Tanacetum cinerariifolium]